MNFVTNFIERNEIKISSFLICILIFLMAVFQQNLKSAKIGIMILICISFFLTCKKKKLSIDIGVFKWYYSFISLFLIYTLYSFFKQTPGSFSYIKVYIIYSLFFLIVNYLFQGKEQLNMLMKILQVIHVTIIIIIIVSLFISIFHLHFFYPICTFFDFKYGLHSGYIEISSNNIDALFFTTPFIFYNIFFNKKALFLNRYMLFILTSIFFIISGRATFQILIMFSLSICIFLKYKLILKKLTKKKLLIFCSIFILSLLSFLFFTGIGNMIVSEFQGLISYGNPRNDQFFSLIRDFFSHPVIGNGLGYVSKVIRSLDMPWAYELTYLYLLSAMGIVGFSIYLFLVFKSTIYLIFKCHHHDLISCVFGTIMMYIANFTNPYLVRFDNMWIVFLPLIIYNCIQNKNTKGEIKNGIANTNNFC